MVEERGRPSILDAAGQEHGPRCTSCGTMPQYSIRGFGNPDASVMAIGIAPGRQEIRWGAPLVGPSGVRHDLCLRAVKYPREKTYSTNLCCFWEDAPTLEQIAGCWPRLKQEIETVQPKLIMALGALSCEWLTSYSIGKVRGNLIRPEYNKSAHFAELEMDTLPTILPTWHPAAALRIGSLTTDILRDFSKIRPFLKGKLEPLVWDHEVVTSKKKAQRILDSLEGKVVALDVETQHDATDSFQRIVCVAIATEDAPGHYRAWVFPTEVLRDVRWPTFATCYEHNSQYDDPAIAREYGVWLPNVKCTMLYSQCVDERPGRDDDSGGDRSRSGEGKKPVGPGYHSLKVLAAEYCLDANTRVLTTTLEWLPLRDIQPGQELIGFDEHVKVPPGVKKNYKIHRKMSTTKVLEKHAIVAPRLLLKTDCGDIIATPDHKWIAITPHVHCGTGFSNQRLKGTTQKFRWRETSTLLVGDVIARLCEPWEKDHSEDTAYLRGFLDREGTLSCKSHEMVNFSQNDGPVAQKACEIFEKMGFRIRKWPDTRTESCSRYEPMGSLSALRIVGRVRPIRFLANPNLKNLWEGKSVRQNGVRHATVLAIEELPPGEVVAIKTSTGTFIAEGLLSHNCGAPPGYGDEMKKSFGKTLEEIAQPIEVPLEEDEGVVSDGGSLPNGAGRGVIALLGDPTSPDNRDERDISIDDTAPPTPESKAKKKKIPMRLETEAEAKKRYLQFLEDLYRYNAYDAINTVALPDRFPRKPCPAYETIITPAARAYARIHLQGVPVDLERVRELQEEWTPWIDELEADLQEQAYDAGYRNAPKLKRDIAAKAEYEAENGEGSWMGEPINLRSPLQVGHFLYKTLHLPVKVRTATGKPSTGAEAIAQITHPFVDGMEELRTAKHVKAAHLDPLPELVKGDGKVHGSIWVIGAANYRRAITSPPWQQYPGEHPKPFWKKLAEVRSVLVPDPGMCLLEADYMQAELWGAALLSQDPVFLADMQSGDYHTRIVREVFHVDAAEDTVLFKHSRLLAKRFNFSVLYKVEENTLSKIMNEGIAPGMPRVTPQMAGRLIRQWYARNRVYWEWQNELIRKVKRTGRLENPFGEYRHFPLWDQLIEKQTCNWPVSSTVGAFAEIAVTELEPLLREQHNSQIFFDTHDSILLQCPVNKRSIVAREVRRVMETPRIDGWPPLLVEFKMSKTNWRELKPWIEKKK